MELQAEFKDGRVFTRLFYYKERRYFNEHFNSERNASI